MTAQARAQDTRTRILVASLLLFNEQGEPNTSTNDIANEVDISPGNLYYHFRKKSDLINALLEEFQADARRVLQPPDIDSLSVEDFWVFLHLLLETMSAYRFLLRDMETLGAHYPKVSQTLGKFVKALVAVVRLYLEGMRQAGILTIDAGDVAVVGRIVVVIALFSERYDALVDGDAAPDESALRTASSVLNALSSYTNPEAASTMQDLRSRYLA